MQNHRFEFILAALGIAVGAACSSPSSPAPSGSSGSSGTGSSSSSSSGGSSGIPAACMPSSIDWVVQGNQNDANSAVYLASELNSDGGLLFLSHVDGISSVPIGGGTITALLSGWILTPKVWLVQDSLLVVAGARIARASKRGVLTELPPMKRRVYGELEGPTYADYDPGTNTVYSAEMDDGGEQPITTFFKHALDTSSTTDLLQVTGVKPGAVVYVGDYLASTLRDASDVQAPSVAYRVPILGGEREALSYGNYDLRALTPFYQGKVFWYGNPPLAGLDDFDASLFRAEAAPGAQLQEVMRVADGALLGSSARMARAEAAGGVLFGVLDDLYFLPDVGAPVQVFCGGGTWHARGFTTSGRTAYVALTEVDGERAGIARIALPQ